ncbi:MAG: [FeFe] hydrogenase H-cluster maturation GTPase HydF [Lachnospiraceae bacterium]|nr:[FeFe] hydrogenase H-cluster maturation GTPase HydF [Lachnospiraceae bacterium]
MGLNDTPSGERVHIGFFGSRNAGKSSVVNAITGQQIAIVSNTPGTTTDPVYKSMELLPLGPVEIIDTPGIDDEGELGEMRVSRTRQVLGKTDIAVLVVDGEKGMRNADYELVELFKEKNLNYIIVMNKADLLNPAMRSVNQDNVIYVSAKNNDNINELKERIAHLTKTDDMKLKLVGDLIEPGDICVLVTPVDAAAPKGRLILPQQQAIRDILEAGGINVVVQEDRLKDALGSLGRKPKIVITDSQAFARVDKDTPSDILLTSFSILMSRYKGTLKASIKGVQKIDELKDGDVVLMSEGCTHHRQCGDIGTVKIPNWLREHTKKDITIETSSGTGFPTDLSKYALVIHCGGCMLNEREMRSRIATAESQNVPITNYGMAIAKMKGILKRSLSPLPEYKDFFE